MLRASSEEHQDCNDFKIGVYNYYTQHGNNSRWHLCIHTDNVKESILKTPKIKLKQHVAIFIDGISLFLIFLCSWHLLSWLWNMQHIKVLNFRKLKIFPPVDKSKIHFELHSLKNVLLMVLAKVRRYKILVIVWLF